MGESGFHPDSNPASASILPSSGCTPSALATSALKNGTITLRALFRFRIQCQIRREAGI